jgi:hypothetical protein
MVSPELIINYELWNYGIMDELGIKSFPTWIIDGKSYPGLKTIPQLVSLSGYKAKP